MDLKQIGKDLGNHLPKTLVNSLINSYQGMKQEFLLGRYEPCVVKGGKFVEAAVRILQHVSTGSYTPLNQSINDMKKTLLKFEQLPRGSTDESIRINIPRILLGVYNLRNKRGAHLSGVDPNRADATVFSSCADWTLAEFIALYLGATRDDAQIIVDGLVQRPLLMVHRMKDIRRVLLPSLTHKDQTLLLLAHEHPLPLSVSELRGAIEVTNITNYCNRVLSTLHANRLIEYNTRNQECSILPPGLKYVEEQYPVWYEKLSSRRGT